MKKIILIFLSLLLVGTFLLGCENEKNNSNQEEKKSENFISSGDENSMLSQDEKAAYKEKAKNALKGLNLNDIEILTQNKTKKPIVMVQVIFDGTKGNINKSEVEEFIKTIKEKIETISNLYDITILDKNIQMIATTGYENEGKIYFKD